MKVCPKCRHINEDTDQRCRSCYYDLVGIRPLSDEEHQLHKNKKRNRNILFIIIVAVIMVFIFVFALNYQGGSYTLPEWITDRMAYQKTSIATQPLPAAYLDLFSGTGLH